MTITGRLTADAAVNETKDGRKVVNYSVAVNDRYKTKDGERKKETAYYECAYWRSEKIAQHLKKGTLVEVTGRIYTNAYVSKDGTAKASLNCHVTDIKILAWPREVSVVGTPTEAGVNADEGAEDMPF